MSVPGIGDVTRCIMAIMVMHISIDRAWADEPTVVSADSVPRVVKCGRDSVYLVLHALGHDVELDDVDRELGYRAEVSLADVRNVLEAHGLYCRSLLVHSSDVDRFADVIHNHGQRRVGIAALPARDAIVTHFAVVVDAGSGGLTIIDATKGDVHQLRLTELQNPGIPVLVVGSDQSLQAPSTRQGPTLRTIALHVASSRIVALGLVCVVAIVAVSPFLPFIVRSGFGAKALRSLLHRAVRLRPNALQGRALLGVAISIPICVAVSYVARVELSPLVADAAEVDLGRQPIGSHHTVRLRILNRSLVRTRTIGSIQVSCSCLDPTVHRKGISPGEWSPIDIGVMVHREGRAEYGVLVTDADSAGSVLIKIRFNGFESTSLSPTYFNVGEFPQGASVVRDAAVKVVNYQGHPVPIEAVKEGESLGTVDVSSREGATLKEDGVIRLHVRNSSTGPLGPFSEKVLLSTVEDNPRKFFLMVYGELVAPMEIHPRAVILDSHRHPAMSSETVVVQSRFSPLEVTTVSTDSDKINVRGQELPNERECRILVELTAAPLESGVAVLRIATRLPVNETIEIPVYFRALSSSRFASPQ
jgi:hypothetical protein